MAPAGSTLNFRETNTTFFTPAAGTDGVVRTTYTATLGGNFGILGSNASDDGCIVRSVSVKEVSPLKGLTLEPAVTNIVNEPIDFTMDNAAWYNNTSIDFETVQDAAVTNPDGSLTAWKFRSKTTTSTGRNLYCEINTKDAAAEIWTASVYVKTAEVDELRLRITNGASTKYVQQYIDLSDGSVGAVSTAAWTKVAAGVEYVNEDWWRVWLTIETDTEATIRMHVQMADSGVTSFPISVNDGLYVWGACLQEGPLASFINGAGGTSYAYEATAPNTLPIETLSEEEGSFECEISCASWNLSDGSNRPVWSGDTATSTYGMYFADSASGYLQLTCRDKNSNYLSSGAFYPPGNSTLQIRLSWSAATGDWSMKVRVKGTETSITKTTSGAFTGFDITGGVLYLIASKTIHLVNMKFYSTPKGQAWVEAL